MSGAVLYAGPSLLTGEPIVCIATLHSANRKTGDMVQTWILPAELDPLAASASGADRAVCGDCPQRHSLGGACYVTLAHAPLTIFRAWKRGIYADWRAALPPRALAGRFIRLGAYGDPAAVPLRIWRRLLRHASGWTGYTHQWRAPHASPFRILLMASVESEAGAREAQALGWRTFRMGDSPAGDVECPATTRGVQCVDCGLCRGRTSDARSVWIRPHGARVAHPRRLPLSAGAPAEAQD